MGKGAESPSVVPSLEGTKMGGMIDQVVLALDELVDGSENEKLVNTINRHNI